MSAPTGEFSVQLSALQTYYGQLWTIHDQLDAALASCSSLQRHAEPSDWYGGHRIQGVETALHVARDSAHGAAGFVGQHHTLKILRRIVRSHLSAIYETYCSYIGADSTHAQDISGSAVPPPALP